jgi:hypothetical protein
MNRSLRPTEKKLNVLYEGGIKDLEEGVQRLTCILLDLEKLLNVQVELLIGRWLEK